MVIVVMTFETAFYRRYFLPAHIVVGRAVYPAKLHILKAVRQDDIDLIRKYFGPKLAFAAILLRVLLLPTSGK
jgi:hypothetical protein